MTTLYEKIKLSDIPKTLEKIIYDIDVYAKKRIKKDDNQSIHAVAEAMADLLLAEEKIHRGPFKPIEFITQVTEATNSIIMVDLKIHSVFATKMQKRINNLIQTFGAIIKEYQEAQEALEYEQKRQYIQK